MTRGPLSRLRPALASLHAYAPPAQPPPVKLDANESPWALPDAVRRDLADALAALDVHRYPDARAGRLRDALADYLRCPRDELLLGSGSDEIISILYTAFGAGAVAFPSPTFVMYRVSALTHGLTPIDIPLDADWQLDLPTFQATLVAHAPVLAFYARPNNPTGQVIPESDLRALAEAAPSTLHVVDEAYVAFDREPDGEAQTFERTSPNVATMGTLSKIGLAGLRVGWLRADPALIAELDKVRQPFNLSMVAQEAARVVLQRHRAVLEEHVRTIVAERARLEDALRSSKAIDAIWPSRANFVLARPREQPHALDARLRERGVGVRAFTDPALAKVVRITVGKPEETDALMRALHA